MVRERIEKIEPFEQGRIKAIALFYSIHTTVKHALTDESLMATESTFSNRGFTGLLNDILLTGMTVDSVIREVSKISDEELIMKLCNYLNEKAELQSRRMKYIERQNAHHKEGN